MKKITIYFIALVLISCSKSSSDSSTPTTPIVTNFKVKYEMVFSSPLIPFPSFITGTGAIFRVTYIDSAGNGAQTYPTLSGTSWSQDVTVVSKTRPVDIGFETTPNFYLSAKGTIISSIYVNNVLWKTKTDTTKNSTTNSISYFTGAVGTFYFPYTN